MKKTTPTQSIHAENDRSLPIYRDPDVSIPERIEDLLGRMTLEEKVAQLYCGGRIPEMKEMLFDADGRLSEARLAELYPHGICQVGRPAQALTPRESAELTNGIQRYLGEKTRLGIPAIFNEEGLHGLMGTGSTSFPQAIALASSWDVEIVEQIFGVVAKEARARGSNYVYTPVLDLARDPRWGRVEETFGEDPYLVTQIGLAAVHGLQGRRSVAGGAEADNEVNQIDPEHVIAAIKHFAVHGQPEGGMNAAPGNISERIIREQFLPPFEAAIKQAGAQAVMVSYNEIDGIPAHTNSWLLDTVLRQEWGFEGFVTSDGFGVPQLMAIHHAAADPAHAARQALMAGVDVEVPQGLCYPSLVEQVRSGLLAEDWVDRAVRRILRAKFLLGLLDEIPQVDPDEAEKATNSPEARKLALKAAEESIVLLKNQDRLLPLNLEKLQKIAVIGPNAADLHLGGYSVDPETGSSILQGILEKAGESKVAYAEGCRITDGQQGWQSWHKDEVVLSDPAQDEDRIAEAVRLAAESDVVILVLGENEGTCREGWWFNHLGDRDDLTLLGNQQRLADEILRTGTPTVMILINGRPLAIPELAEAAPALLECWYLGQETGSAVAMALFGEINPSGKLPVTFPRSVGQLPVYYYHKPSAKRGYLFSETAPLFPFGFGLSYTTFSYHNLRLDKKQIGADASTTARIDVTNTGGRAGDEIVQLYVHDQVSTITRPVKELKGFARIHLEPGETRPASFEIGPEQLFGLDFHMQPVVEPGVFEIMIGADSQQTEMILLEVVDSVER